MDAYARLYLLQNVSNIQANTRITILYHHISLYKQTCTHIYSLWMYICMHVLAQRVFTHIHIYMHRELWWRVSHRDWHKQDLWLIHFAAPSSKDKDVRIWFCDELSLCYCLFYWWNCWGKWFIVWQLQTLFVHLWGWFYTMRTYLYVCIFNIFRSFVLFFVSFSLNSWAMPSNMQQNCDVFMHQHAGCIMICFHVFSSSISFRH